MQGWAVSNSPFSPRKNGPPLRKCLLVRQRSSNDNDPTSNSQMQRNRFGHVDNNGGSARGVGGRWNRSGSAYSDGGLFVTKVEHVDPCLLGMVGQEDINKHIRVRSCRGKFNLLTAS